MIHFKDRVPTRYKCIHLSFLRRKNGAHDRESKGMFIRLLRNTVTTFWKKVHCIFHVIWASLRSRLHRVLFPSEGRRASAGVYVDVRSRRRYREWRRTGEGYSDKLDTSTKSNVSDILITHTDRRERYQWVTERPSRRCLTIKKKDGWSQLSHWQRERETAYRCYGTGLGIPSRIRQIDIRVGLEYPVASLFRVLSGFSAAIPQ